MKNILTALTLVLGLVEGTAVYAVQHMININSAGAKKYTLTVTEGTQCGLDVIEKKHLEPIACLVRSKQNGVSFLTIASDDFSVNCDIEWKDDKLSSQGKGCRVDAENIYLN